MTTTFRPAVGGARLLRMGAHGLLLFNLLFLVGGATRPDYDPWRHAVSQLSLGPLGWINAVGIVVAGLSFIALAAGLRAALPGRGGATWGPRLMASVGASFLAMAVFPIDPALGYPPGADAGHSLGGLIHGVAGTIAFGAWSACCFVLAGSAPAGPRGIRWALVSRIAGAVVAAGYLATALLTGLAQAGVLSDAPAGLAQRVALVTGSVWVVLLVGHLSGDGGSGRTKLVLGSAVAVLACGCCAGGGHAMSMKPMWSHSVDVAVPIAEAWQHLSRIETRRYAASDAPLALQSGATLDGATAVEVSGGPRDFLATVSKGGTSFRVKLQVSPETQEVAVEGEWWFRGVLHLESTRPSLTRLTLRVYNIAPSPGRLVVPLVARGMKEKTELDLRAIAQRLAR